MRGRDKVPLLHAYSAGSPKRTLQNYNLPTTPASVLGKKNEKKMQIEEFKQLAALYYEIKDAENALKNLQGNELSPEKGLKIEVETCNYDMGHKICRDANLVGDLAALVLRGITDTIKKYHTEKFAEFEQINLSKE